ncbi:MAG: signal peptidase I [Candidatus Hodarchaeaceae archaeon]|nr:signal peptidase I [Candidatus Hodarchaeaceae archaeon]
MFKNKRQAKGKTLRRRLARVVGHEVVREVIIAILIISILYFGLRGALMLALNTESPMMAVVSNSMKPTFERGDLLLIRGVSSPAEIAIGDIIVFRSEHQSALIVHRVIEKIIDENGRVWFKTQGDANPGPDPTPVRPEDIKGKVTFMIPKLGHISLLLRGS